MGEVNPQWGQDANGEMSISEDEFVGVYAQVFGTAGADDAAAAANELFRHYADPNGDLMYAAGLRELLINECGYDDVDATDDQVDGLLQVSARLYVQWTCVCWVTTDWFDAGRNMGRMPMAR